MSLALTPKDSAGQMSAQQATLRAVSWVHLGLPEARFYLGCAGHMHAFRRVGYRSGVFLEDAIAKATGSAA